MRVSLSMSIVLWFEVKVNLSGLGIISKAFSRMTRILDNMIQVRCGSKVKEALSPNVDCKPECIL